MYQCQLWLTHSMLGPYEWGWIALGTISDALAWPYYHIHTVTLAVIQSLNVTSNGV